MAAAGVAYPVLALRLLVVLPGALVEGALAVALPWLVAKQTQGTAWLGIASAGLMGAALLGALVAPSLEQRAGPRRMTVLAAFAAAGLLVLALWCWAAGQPTLAYLFALTAVAADAACDVGFTARLPVLARLARQRLDRFSAGNWLWAIGGAAVGSVAAGWALDAQRHAALMAVLAATTLAVAVALVCVLPREAKSRRARPAMRSLADRGLWRRPLVQLTGAMAALVVFAGPVDNLLLPVHLSSHGWPAEAFGETVAALGLGVACGLALMQGGGTPQQRPLLIGAGLLGLALQLVVVLWLPPRWSMLAGVFVGAALFAPLLPMAEAAALKAAPPAQRTLFVAAWSTLLGVCDVIGTVGFGALVTKTDSTTALGVCVAAALTAVAAYAAYARRRGRRGPPAP
jgi:MFS family permease